ncbi:PLDc N-terminal domain-containing protein [Crossiella cryophila]|uniref:Cardiolipin synthase N-terminal domain-containing protein n=1 Tax=Crossiella cryophila TaxID=43355 RepID=A0A7W7CF43_9PSEU|nr:PLDc N-terminal domain-containing protein [Crossiella cryophila]MBB4680036.1 hypothetical protein [Crossiella cryophila]
MAKRRWADLTSTQRGGIVALGLVQLTLASLAWRDLSRRPAEQVRGPKRLWALAIGVNFAGPLAYFRFGRVRAGAHRPD